MNKANKINRRNFIKNTTGIFITSIGFPAIIPAKVFGQQGKGTPNDRITLGAGFSGKR
jgi:hypothetical protein